MEVGGEVNTGAVGSSVDAAVVTLLVLFVAVGHVFALAVGTWVEMCNCGLESVYCRCCTCVMMSTT